MEGRYVMDLSVWTEAMRHISAPVILFSLDLSLCIPETLRPVLSPRAPQAAV